MCIRDRIVRLLNHGLDYRTRQSIDGESRPADHLLTQFERHPDAFGG